MSKSTSVKNGAPKSGGTKGGGLYLPDPWIEGATDGVVDDTLLAKGPVISMPYVGQGQYYFAFFVEQNNPENYLWLNRSQAYEQNKPVQIHLRTEEAARLKGEKVFLFWQHRDPKGSRVSGLVPYILGTP